MVLRGPARHGTCGWVRPCAAVLCGGGTRAQPRWVAAGGTGRHRARQQSPAICDHLVCAGGDPRGDLPLGAAPGNVGHRPSSEDSMTAYQSLEARFRREALLGEAKDMLNWDTATLMPEGAAPARAEQV